MAVREVYTLIRKNANILATTQLHAGAASAIGSDGNLVAADRATHTRGMWLGILADDTARSGNTMVGVDPVGATWLSTDGTTFFDYTNGVYVAARRALDQNQDELVTNIANLVDGAGGFAGPRRPASVYSSPSTVVQTDQFSLFKTADTSGPYVAVDSAFTGGDAYLYGSLLAFGTGANAGKFVLCTNPAITLVVAIFNKWADAASALMEITLIA